MRPRSANVRKTVLVFAAAALALSGCDWPQFRNGPERSGAARSDWPSSRGYRGSSSDGPAPPVARSRRLPPSREVSHTSDRTMRSSTRTTRRPARCAGPGAPAARSWAHRRSPPAWSTSVRPTPSCTRSTRSTERRSGREPSMKPTAVSVPRRRVVGERVYIASANSVYALDSIDGATVWASPLAGPLSPPAVAGGLVYVTAYANGSVTALRESDGTVAWTTPLPGERTGCPDVLPTPAVSGGVVYASLCPAGDGDDSLAALDATTGAIVWSAGGSAFTTSPAVASGLVYVGSASTQTLEARNVADGSLAWAGAVGDAIYSSPTVAKDVVFVGTDDGSVLGVRCQGPDELRRDRPADVPVDVVEVHRRKRPIIARRLRTASCTSGPTTARCTRTASHPSRSRRAVCRTSASRSRRSRGSGPTIASTSRSTTARSRR